MTKAIALLSGGLDSILATKLILKQGIEVEAVNFLTVFCNCAHRGKNCLSGKSAADSLGIKLKVFEVSKEYFDIVKNPRYGYGSNMNPCLDCRIFMLKKAGEYMKETEASFLITGEVLGQRPMSQRRDAIRIIDRDSGLDGLILRPLSAKMFKPTIPEETGLVDREKLLDIKGRSRKPQIQLAKELDVNDYPGPAGGCLLSDPGFAKRMKDLIKHKPDFTINDVRFLKAGRHFRLSPETKLIVGRNKDENANLLNLAREGELCFYPVEVKGPVGIGRGRFNAGSIVTASSIIARYSDGKAPERLEVAYRRVPNKKPEFIVASPIEEAALEEIRV